LRAQNDQRRLSGVADHFSKFAAVPIASRMSEVEATAARAVLGFLKSDPKKPENVPKTGPFSRKKQTISQVLSIAGKQTISQVLSIADNNNTTQC
jgi:hypothetical protein